MGRASGPSVLEVLRQFEPSRLAPDCQARAYALVPVNRALPEVARGDGGIEEESPERMVA
jgi:hypothetical protein